MKNWAWILMPVWSLPLGLILVMIQVDGENYNLQYPVLSIPSWFVTVPTGYNSSIPPQPGPGISLHQDSIGRLHPFAFESNARPPDAAKKELRPLHLTLIAVVGNKKICRINGQLFTEEQKGNGFQVVRINNTSVEIMLDTDRQPLALYLNPSEDSPHDQK